MFRQQMGMGAGENESLFRVQLRNPLETQITNILGHDLFTGYKFNFFQGMGS